MRLCVTILHFQQHYWSFNWLNECVVSLEVGWLFRCASRIVLSMVTLVIGRLRGCCTLGGVTIVFGSWSSGVRVVAVVIGVFIAGSRLTNCSGCWGFRRGFPPNSWILNWVVFFVTGSYGSRSTVVPINSGWRVRRFWKSTKNCFITELLRVFQEYLVSTLEKSSRISDLGFTFKVGWE